MRCREPLLQVVGAAARLARVETGPGLAGLLLQPELLGAAVPVCALLGQPFLHRGPGLADPGQAPIAHLRDMLRHDVGNRLVPRLLLQVPRDPGALGAREDLPRRRFVIGQGPVVEIGGVMQVMGLPLRVDLHVEHAPRDDPALAAGP